MRNADREGLHHRNVLYVTILCQNLKVSFWPPGILKVVDFIEQPRVSQVLELGVRRTQEGVIAGSHWKSLLPLRGPDSRICPLYISQPSGGLPRLAFGPKGVQERTSCRFWAGWVGAGDFGVGRWNS